MNVLQQTRQRRRPLVTDAHQISFRKLGSEKLDAEGDLPLSDFAGKAVLVVNVASACGLTPQYRELEQLYQTRKNDGLVIIGAPCNEFGGQEPGEEAEIATFCDTRYKVSFPMTGKLDIIARERRHPFYQWIAGELGEEALPRWNFHKYLIGKDGQLVESFSSQTSPMAREVICAIDKALAE
ncbi:MAG: glutathione peroxidase [Hyphomonadaceae bacterium]|nr:glutathione peroxidase [Hyphomonadaceae bacterium]